MGNTKQKHTYIFVNPNKPEAFVLALRKILIGKLLALRLGDSTVSE